MLRSILIGVDGSSFGAAAIDLGVRWAQHSKALLVGLAIIDQTAICGAEAVPLGGMAFKQHRDEALLAEARHKAARALEEFSTRCSDLGVACDTVEATDLPVDQVLREAQRYDLILLGKKTYFHSDAQPDTDNLLREVVKNSPRPVAVVPEKPRSGDAVVIAYDGSLQAARTLQAFQSSGLSGTEHVHVISVHPDQAEAALRADRAVAFLRFHDITAFSHAIADADAPARTILERLDALRGGMLVMGAYGQPTFKELFFGSVTQMVLDKSAVPVFLCH